MNFLFRRDPRHIFMTTQDPSYLYTVLCGRCDYPIEAGDEFCPRCQSRLEDCPVCRELRHTRAPFTAPCPDTGRKTCPVCETQRYQFGTQTLGSLEGAFCSNLYGCPAGGLLLKTKEFAVLREDASICPVCRHPDLKPFNLRTFVYLVSQCVFCSTVFGTPSSWRQDSPAKWDVTVDHVKSTPPRDYSPCPLCGREDTYPEGAQEVEMLVDQPDALAGAKEKMLPDLYARVAELGKIIILENDNQAAAKKWVSSWFNELNLISQGSHITVERVGEYLLQGTRKPEVHKILRARLVALLDEWKAQVPGQGLNYKVSGRNGGKR
jgi:RNA polymerase subunit RPABC4/transcription elongation factor Spt4